MMNKIKKSITKLYEIVIGKSNKVKINQLNSSIKESERKIDLSDKCSIALKKFKVAHNNGDITQALSYLQINNALILSIDGDTELYRNAQELYEELHNFSSEILYVNKYKLDKHIKFIDDHSSEMFTNNVDISQGNWVMSETVADILQINYLTKESYKQCTSTINSEIRRLQKQVENANEQREEELYRELMTYWLNYLDELEKIESNSIKEQI